MKVIPWGSQNRRYYYQGEDESLELKISRILIEMEGMEVSSR